MQDWKGEGLERSRIGIVQDWKSVGLEGFKTGRMQNWKGEGLEECKIGKVRIFRFGLAHGNEPLLVKCGTVLTHLFDHFLRFGSKLNQR